MKGNISLRHIGYLTLLAACLLLTSCAVGPDFETPPPPKTKHYVEGCLPKKTTEIKGTEAGKPQYFVCGKDIPAEWWTIFRSEALDCLIKRALKNSPTLSSAQAAWRQAEANLTVAQANLFPFINVQPQYQRQGENYQAFGLSVVPYTTYNLYNAPINVSYTLDVFGGIRRQMEAAQAQLDLQKHTIEATFLTLTSNIVTASITEASLRAQIEATQQLVCIQSKILAITQQRFALGVASAFDVLAQQSQLAKIKATLLPLTNSLAQTRHALAILVGETPHEAKIPCFHLEDLHLPGNLPVSVPSSLVRQRPDIRVAEEVLHAASAQIGVAVANLLPQATISGNYGWSANILSDYFQPENIIWNLTAGLLQPIFEGGSLWAKRKAAIASFDQAYCQYKHTVLQAFQNVADVLQALQTDANQLCVQTANEQANLKTLELVRIQYKLGAVEYPRVLQAELQYWQARVGRVQAQASRYADTAALFQALGGGWWNRKVRCRRDE